jgi:hypothetical protein
MDLNKTSYNLEAINSSIHELVHEAKILFSTFDAISSSICKLEKDLNDSKAYFPFKFKARIDLESCAKKPEPRHDTISYDLLGYRTCTYWYLAWEAAEENTKNFRLFLIGEEKEIIYYSIPGDDPESCGEQEFQTKNVFKKPLMETSLSIRIQYSEYLIPFIDSFKDYLKSCRLIIEQGGIPF